MEEESSGYCDSEDVQYEYSDYSYNLPSENKHEKRKYPKSVSYSSNEEVINSKKHDTISKRSPKILCTEEDFNEMEHNKNCFNQKCFTRKQQFAEAKNVLKGEANRFGKQKGELLTNQNRQHNRSKTIPMPKNEYDEIVRMMNNLDKLNRKLTQKNEELMKQNEDLKKGADESHSKDKELLRKENEMKILKKSLEQQKSLKSNENSALVLIESIIESQRNEISTLAQQRKDLINCSHKLSHCCTALELQVSNVENELNASLLQIEKLKCEVKNVKDENSKKWEATIEDARKLAPEYFINNAEENKSEQLLKGINKLLKETKSKDSLASKNKHNECLHRAILGHLQNAVSCLKRIAGENNKPSLKDDVCSTITKIRAFLSNCPDKVSVPSLFEPDCKESIEKRMESLQMLIDSNESPYSEIFTILDGVLQVNHILMEKNEALSDLLNIQQQNNKCNEKCQKEFDSLKKKLELTNNKVVAALSSVIPGPCANPEQMLDYVITNLDKLSLKESINTSRESIEELYDQIDEIKAKNKEERRIFCKKASKMVEKIKNEYSNALTEKDQEIQELYEVNNEYKEALEKINQNVKQIKNDSANEIDAISEAYDELLQENDSLKKEIEQVRGCYAESMKEHDEEIVQIEKKLKNSMKKEEWHADKASYHQQQAKYYKERLEDLQRSVNQSVVEAEMSVSKIKENCDKEKQKLNETVSEIKSENERLKREALDYQTTKADLDAEVAQLRVTEKSLIIKQKSLQDTIDRMKSEYESCAAAMKNAIATSTSTQISSLNNRLLMITKTIRRFLNDEFERTLRDDVTPEDALKELLLLLSEYSQDAKESKQMKECIALIGADPSKSLSESIKNLMRQNQNYVEENKTLSQKLSSAQEENKKLNIKAKVKEMENDELKICEKWFRAINFQLTGNAFASMESSRKVIEDTLISSPNQIKIIRKVDMLRFEKQAMMQFKTLVLSKLHNQNTVRSIRPLTIAIIFSQRVLMLENCRLVHM